MKYIRTSYKKYSKIYNILFFLISIGFTLGLIIALYLSDNIALDIYNYFKDIIENYNSSILSNIIYPIIIILLIFLFSLTIIGYLMPFFTIFIENMSIGLIIGVLLKKAGLNGLLFGIIYFLFTKLFYIIILIYIIINLYKFVKKFIISIKNKNNNSIYSLYSKIILKIIFSIIIITIYNLISIFLIPKIIKLFIFLL